jgi:heterodisulfide reductase subunit A
MGCHRCEKVCDFDAISVNENDIAEVDDLKCKGCGACVISCPARAIDLKYFRDLQFEEEIKGIGGFEVKIENAKEKIVN